MLKTICVDDHAASVDSNTAAWRPPGWGVLRRLMFLVVVAAFGSLLCVPAGAQCTAEYVSRTGGDPRAYFARLTTLYVGYAGKLEILDTSVPSTPVLVGSVLLPGVPERMDFFSNHLYVAMGDGGLAIVDVTNPAVPVLASTIQITATTGIFNDVNDVAASNGLAFVMTSSDLFIYDVSAPAAPVLESTWPATINAAVVSKGSTAYLVDSVANVEAIDATNPAAPVLLSSYNLTLSSIAEDMALRGNLLAVITLDGTELIDITNPAALVFRSTVLSTSSVTQVSLAENAGTTLLYCETDSCTISAYDVTNPAAPVFKSSVSHCSNTFASAQNMLYVGGDQLNFYNFAAPAVPVLEHNSDPQPDFVKKILAVGPQYLWMIKSDNELKVYDVSNPLSPNSIHTRVLGVQPEDMARSGGRVYIAMFDSTNMPIVTGRIQVFDAQTNSAFPIFLAEFATDRYLLKIAVDGNRAFTLDGDERLEIFDVSNLGAITKLGELANVGRDSIHVNGNTVFVGDSVDGVKVIDVSVPSAPTLLATHAPRANERLDGLVVRNSTAFVLQSDDRIDILDVSDPINPAQLSTITTSTNFWTDIGMVDSLLFISVNGVSVRIYDTADPSNPVQHPIVKVGGFMSDFAISGTTLWATSTSAGLAGISVPQIPRVVEWPADAITCGGAGSGNVQFSTRVSNPTNAGGATYRWTRNGVALTNGAAASGAVFSGVLTRTMSIAGATLAEVGTYACEITNTCGTVTTETARLTAGLAPTITQQPTNAAACYRGSGVFEITGLGTTPFTFQWQRETPLGSGNFVTMSDTVQADFSATGSATRTLTIAPAAGRSLPASVATNYRCRIMNVCGNVVSNAARLSVCRGDFNCTGGAEVQDIFDFLNAWFASDPLADFDGNGAIEVQDIFDFLNAWFAGC